jgi:hypothetical protein
MSPVRDHILQEINTLRFRTHKIARSPPNKKPRMGGGLRHLPQSPFKDKFLEDDSLLCCLYS